MYARAIGMWVTLLAMMVRASMFIRSGVIGLTFLLPVSFSLAAPVTEERHVGSSADRAFMTEMASACLLQVALGYLAQGRGNTAAREYGERMVIAHEAWTKEVRILGVAMDIVLPNALTERQRVVVERLRDLPRPEFNDAYAREVTAAHEAMVDLFEQHLNGGAADSLRPWLRRVVVELKGHLAIAHHLAMHLPGD